MTTRLAPVVVGLLFSAAAAAALEKPPTWAERVAPILFEHCASCHAGAGPGPFSLLEYGEAAPRARRIAEVTSSRFMPPWLPEPGPDFAGERRLARDEIETLARWARAGAPRGDPSREPDPPARSDGWQLGEPDLVLSMQQPYILPASGPDVFRNFVVPVPEAAAGRWVSALELRPANPRVVHHAVVTVDATPSSRRLAAADPEPGFDGMRTFSRARIPDGHLLGWTPGSVPAPGDPDLAWELRAGDDLVLELHMLPSGTQEAVTARLGLHFTDTPPSRRPLALRLGSKTIDIPAGAERYTTRDEIRLPAAVEVRAVYPHAHYLGRKVEATAHTADGAVRTLLRIPQWDFMWQDQYRYRRPLVLPAGTVLRLEWVFDNSASNPRNPHSPPQRVVYGPSSLDEMGDLWLQVVPLDAQDFSQLAARFERHETEADVAAYRAAVERSPADGRLRFKLGSELVLLDRLDEGIQQLRRAVELDPGLAAAHTNLGNALLVEGRLEAAAEHFLRTVELEPRAPEAHFNLANTLAALGRWAEAHARFDTALRLRPAYAEARLNKGLAYARQGQREAARRQLELALENNPRYVPALYNLARLLAAEGRADEALARVDDALELEPQSQRLHLARGDVLFDLGRLEEALATYRDVLAAEPSSTDARTNVAITLAQLGRRDEALAELREVLRRDPGHVAARRILTGLERAR